MDDMHCSFSCYPILIDVRLCPRKFELRYRDDEDAPAADLHRLQSLIPPLAKYNPIQKT